MTYKKACVNRYHAQDTSTNKDNPNKNPCGLAVCKALRVADKVKYLHTVADILRCIRKLWRCQARNSKVKGLRTVEDMREKLAEIADKEGATARKVIGFLIFVENHVLLTNEWGQTAIDTAPLTVDYRQVKMVYIVYKDRV